MGKEILSGNKTYLTYSLNYTPLGLFLKSNLNMGSTLYIANDYIDFLT